MSPVPDEEHDKNDGDDIEGIESPNLVIPDVLDDSDDIDNDIDDPAQGYELLPQGPEDVNGSPLETDSDTDSGLSEGEVEGQVITDHSHSPEVVQATGLAPGGLYTNFPQGELPSYLQVQNLPKPDKNELLWNHPRTTSANNMDSGKISAIKTAMKGFQLPTCNIPDWAINISEDKWKEQFVSRISSSGSNEFPKENYPNSPADSSASSCDANCQSSDQTGGKV